VEFSKQVERVWKTHAIWNTRLGSLWLHGSEQAVVAAYQLDHALAQLGEWILDHPIPEAEWVDLLGLAHHTNVSGASPLLA
jgi:hypothetical protein